MYIAQNKDHILGQLIEEKMTPPHTGKTQYHGTGHFIYKVYLQFSVNIK